MGMLTKFRSKAANWLDPVRRLNGLSPPMSASMGGWEVVFSTSQPPTYFQRDIKMSPETILAYPPVYACVTLIANDIGKMRYKLMQQNEDSIWNEIQSPAFSPVLRKPNRYQNHVQFKQAWITSKLINGNTYALKERDARGVVTALYLLDSYPGVVTPLVAPDGSVFYQLTPDNLTGLEDVQVVVPASEIIHDRMNCFFHPLVGIGPMAAAALSAEQGQSIQIDSNRFFSQGAKPSGILVAPGAISQQTADSLREYWNKNFTGENAGRVAVVGDGLKYEPIRFTSSDSQTVEQIKLTSEFVAMAFHMPLFKLGGTLPAGLKVSDQNLVYYSDCLQSLIEEMEVCLDEGLNLPNGMRTELDTDALLRMDPASMATVLVELSKGALMKPNEARQRLNLPPVKGGDTVYMQQQNYSLSALDERDKTNPLAATPAPTPASAPVVPAANDEDPPIDTEQARALLAHIAKGLEFDTD